MSANLSAEGDGDAPGRALGEDEAEVPRGRHQGVLVRGLGLVLQLACRVGGPRGEEEKKDVWMIFPPPLFYFKLLNNRGAFQAINLFIANLCPSRGRDRERPHFLGGRSTLAPFNKMHQHSSNSP